MTVVNSIRYCAYGMMGTLPSETEWSAKWLRTCSRVTLDLFQLQFVSSRGRANDDGALAGALRTRAHILESTQDPWPAPIPNLREPNMHSEPTEVDQSTGPIGRDVPRG